MHANMVAIHKIVLDMLILIFFTNNTPYGTSEQPASVYLQLQV